MVIWLLLRIRRHSKSSISTMSIAITKQTKNNKMLPTWFSSWARTRCPVQFPHWTLSPQHIKQPHTHIKQRLHTHTSNKGYTHTHIKQRLHAHKILPTVPTFFWIGSLSLFWRLLVDFCRRPFSSMAPLDAGPLASGTSILPLAPLSPDVEVAVAAGSLWQARRTMVEWWLKRRMMDWLVMLVLMRLSSAIPR